MTMAAVAAKIAIAVAINVASGYISGKIAGDPDQPAQIGSGTSPSLSPGPDIEISPIEGSSVTSGDNAFTADSTGSGMDPQAMILQQLQEAGVDVGDLDQYGIAGMAVGGYLRRAQGGGMGILQLLKEQGLFDPEDAPDVNFSEIAVPSIEDQYEESMFAEMKDEYTDRYIDPTELSDGPDAPEVLPDPTAREQMSDWYESQDASTQDAMMSGLSSIGSALATRLFGGGPERRGSLVRTETLPGNAARRRTSLKMNPISGSSVTFANQGSALQRPMFMPNGGAMYGPGGSRDDLIPVMASNGEYMLSKAAVDQAGNGSHAMGIANLEKFNKAGNKRYG